MPRCGGVGCREHTVRPKFLSGPGQRFSSRVVARTGFWGVKAEKGEAGKHLIWRMARSGFAE